MKKKIKKAVIAVAGYGTRFLPATKAQPKEMLPIVDKPIVQYLVEEAVESGIEDIILVTRFGSQALENHFDSNFELEYQLEKNGKHDRLHQVQKVSKMANFIYVRQGKHLPYGNATPLMCVDELIDDSEAFVYMFGDDLVRAKPPCTKQLIKAFKTHWPDAMLAVQKVPWKEIIHYAAPRYKKGTKINQVEELVEKPSVKLAKVKLSNFAQFGRFIFTKKVIEIAKAMPTGKDNELWVADALNRLAKTGVVIAEPIKGDWMTTGDPLRYMQTQVKFALDRQDIGPEFKKFLKTLSF